MRLPASTAFSLGALVATVSAQEAGAPIRADAGRPNVLLVMADDLGYGDVGFLGSDRARTPALDEMAAAGLVLERFYAAAPVCSPTRGSVLTGRHPYRYGIRGANAGHLPADEPNLAELLRAEGYATGHFGKWHLGTLTRTERDSNRGGPRGAAHYAPPWERGFEVCFATEAKVPTWDPMRKPGSDEPYGTGYWTGPDQRATEGLEGDDSRVIVDRALPFLREAVADERPFLAVVWFHAPHRPVLAGPAHRAPFADRPEAEQHYLGCVAALDEQVGRLRAELRELGVSRHTIVWFCSDNGPEGRDGEPLANGSTGGLRGRKRSLREGGVRVPAILEWPTRVEPGHSTLPAVTTDTLPTVCAALGLPLPEAVPLDGVDLLEALARGERGAPIGFESVGQVAWHEGRYKLYRAAREGAAWELYDLDSDPREATDLAADEADRVAEMATRAAIWRADCARDAADEGR